MLKNLCNVFKSINFNFRSLPTWLVANTNLFLFFSNSSKHTIICGPCGLRESASSYKTGLLNICRRASQMQSLWIQVQLMVTFSGCMKAFLPAWHQLAKGQVFYPGSAWSLSQCWLLSPKWNIFELAWKFNEIKTNKVVFSKWFGATAPNTPGEDKWKYCIVVFYQVVDSFCWIFHLTSGDQYCLRLVVCGYNNIKVWGINT